MQCKDIPDIPILEFLYEIYKKNPNQTQWTCAWNCDDERKFMPSIWDAMPSWVNQKLVTAKMYQLYKRRFIDGNGSTSALDRGDYVITQKGIEFLIEQKEGRE